MIKSNVYHLSRTEMARLAGEEFLRTFWWIVVAVPLFGFGCLAYGTIEKYPPVQLMGFIAILWPFSIPARAVLSSSKSSRLFTAGCHVEATEDEVAFIGEYIDGKRLRYPVKTNRLKEVVRRKGILIIRSRIPGFLPVKEGAFDTEADLETFIKTIESGIAKWQGAEGAT